MNFFDELRHTPSLLGGRAPSVEDHMVMDEHTARPPQRPATNRPPRRPAPAAAVKPVHRHHRRNITGIDRMTAALHEREQAREALREAERGLESLLPVKGLEGLDKAYGEFLAEGGATVHDWRRWLDGEPLEDRKSGAAKEHLRIVASKSEPLGFPRMEAARRRWKTETPTRPPTCPTVKRPARPDKNTSHHRHHTNADTDR